MCSDTTSKQTIEFLPLLRVIRADIRAPPISFEVNNLLAERHFGNFAKFLQKFILSQGPRLQDDEMSKGRSKAVA